MKKCAYCGLLNEDAAGSCVVCGFKEFDSRPPDRRLPAEKQKVLSSSLTAERHGAIVTLKCRTPDEANLVRETLESADVIALLPHEQEMLLQFRRDGYVEVQVPANVYDASPDLRSIIEFSTTVQGRRPAGGASIPLISKLFAAFLGIFIVPGLLVFTWMHTSYEESGQESKAKELKIWFLIGVGSWAFIIVGCLAFGR